MSADPLIGRKLGDYSIQLLLGRGGMSRVYRGLDENLDRFAAVKVISGDFVTTTEEEYTRRFQIEARAIARLRHPNIVGIYQFGRTEGIYYMAMVFLEGRDLRSLLKDYADRGQRIPTTDLMRIIRDVASALDYAHEQGVIHRDIKPSNIMLEKNTGRAILMDFGLALSIQEGTTGDTFGSAHYIAPEQAISSAKSVPQSDLYSLGIVIYEMLTGKVPFDDPSAMSVALKHLNELPPPPSMYNPDLPPAVETVIMRVLDKDPNRRYLTGFELVKALEKAFKISGIDGAGPSQVPVAAPSLPQTESQPSRPSSPGLAGDAQPVMEPEAHAERGVAGRFARRKAHKEEQAALQSMTEDALQIDTATLDSILGGYSDPRDIGLVGPDAKPITIPERPSQLSREVGGKKKRSRVGLLLATVLIFIVVISAAWFGFVGGKDKDNTEAAIVGTEDAGQAVAVVTDEATASVTEAVETASATAASTEDSTGEAATKTPTEDSGQVTSDASSHATMTAIAEAGSVSQQTQEALEPIATATAEAQPVQTSATDTPRPSSTPRPSTSTGTTSPTPARQPNIRLMFDEDVFNLINVTDETLNVSELIFEQELNNGARLIFEANTWNKPFMIEPPARMGMRGCFQVVTSTGTQSTPSRSDCPRFLGWYRVNDPAHYFWLAEDANSAFSVRVAGDPTILATCLIAEGECSFYLPQD